MNTCTSSMKAQIQSIISSLPREDGWLSSSGVFLYQYQGFWYYRRPLEGIIASQINQTQLNFFPSDIILCTAPKSGTTWLKALAFAIATRRQYQEARDSPLMTKLPHLLIPSLEYSIREECDPQLPLLCTHLPYTRLPESALDIGCKMVHVCRDPKDAFVSSWHFAHKMRPNQDSSQPISPDQAFDLFCRGMSLRGPYWDNILSYWKASQERPEKVLFLKYEDMISDPVLSVMSLAKFMDYPFSSDEEETGLPLKIVEMCSFESMSNLNVNKSGMTPYGVGVLANDIFFRKGKVGDWKNYLSEEMAKRMDQITREKLNCFGLHL